MLADLKEHTYDRHKIPPSLLHGRCPPVLAVGLAALGGWGLAGP